MTKNERDIQKISTKQTDFQTDRILLFGQVTKEQEIANSKNGTFYATARRTISVILKVSLPTEKQLKIKGQIL